MTLFNTSNFFLLLFLITVICSNCVMVNSSIGYKKQKHNTIIEKTPEYPATSNPTILDTEINLEDYINQPSTPNSTFFISMINYHTDTYIEARFKRETSDTVFLECISKNLQKSDVFEFGFFYLKSEIDLESFSSLKNGDYLATYEFNIPDSSKQINKWKEQLTFRKFQSFEIERNLLHFYSGEIRERGIHSKFLVLNDYSKINLPKVFIAASQGLRNHQIKILCKKKLKTEQPCIGLSKNAKYSSNTFKKGKWYFLERDKYECSYDCK